MRCSQRGFTYLLALFAAGAAALIAMKAVPVLETYEQREKEAELLFIGQQFRKAIASYYESTPGTLRRYPSSLEDLLLDRRFVQTKRHLRHIYHDPFTRQAEWGLIYAPDGRIQGVHSLYDGRPVKRGGFRTTDAELAGADSYQRWKFIYWPQQ